MEPHTHYSVIKDLLESHNIKQYTFWDNSYVICGNEDIKELGITHSGFIKALDIYDELLNEYLIKYTPEVFDCDDFAHLLKTAFALARVNSCIYAVGRLYYKGNLLGYHAFNLLPWAFTRDNANLVLLLIEPQLFPWGGITTLNKDATGRLFNYIYEVLYVEV